MKVGCPSILVSVMLLAVAVIADAQQPTKVPRIGYLSDSNPARESARSKAIGLALRELGYTEGRTIITEYRFAEGRVRSSSRPCGRAWYVSTSISSW